MEKGNNQNDEFRDKEEINTDKIKEATKVIREQIRQQEGKKDDNAYNLALRQGIRHWILQCETHRGNTTKLRDFYEHIFEGCSTNTIEAYKSNRDSKVFADEEQTKVNGTSNKQLKVFILGFKKLYPNIFRTHVSWLSCIQTLIDSKNGCPPNIQEQFFQSTTIQQQPLSPNQTLNSEKLNILILGTHDDAEFCNKIIHNKLNNDMGHNSKSIDYYQEENPKVILRRMEQSIQSNYNVYVIVKGATYGNLLYISDDEEAKSKRHHELHRSSVESSKSHTPMIVLAAATGSPLDKEFEANRQALFESHFKGDMELFQQDKQKLSRLNDTIELLEKHNVATPLLDIENNDDLAVRLETSLIAHTNITEQLNNQSPGNQTLSLKNPPTSNKLLDEAESIYKSFKEESQANISPGFCLLIHSSNMENANNFAKEISEKELWPSQSFFNKEFEHYEDDIIESILKALWSETGKKPQNHEINDFEKLAEALVKSQHSCMLILKNLDRTLNLGKFFSQIWNPLYNNIDSYIANKKTKPERWAIINIVISCHTKHIEENDKQLKNESNSEDHKKSIYLIEVKK